MLSNKTILETKIQRLLDGSVFVEKGLGVHVQRMFKMSRVYTLAEIFSKIFVKKKGKFVHGTMYDKLQTYSFIKIYYAITTCTTYTFIYGNVD